MYAISILNFLVSGILSGNITILFATPEALLSKNNMNKIYSVYKKKMVLLQASLQTRPYILFLQVLTSLSHSTLYSYLYLWTYVILSYIYHCEEEESMWYEHFHLTSYSYHHKIDLQLWITYFDLNAWCVLIDKFNENYDWMLE